MDFTVPALQNSTSQHRYEVLTQDNHAQWYKRYLNVHFVFARRAQSPSPYPYPFTAAHA